ncbi:hypothetical protein HRG_004174 [Hirsutella rhossiliensis]|uniref:Uncharacterized protein n=1 Tax=Hirsutella rhossiliensis TaxID=111463 RepID=A0A9P8N0Z9_9HYPO|nr:uncharacterized protein HRG_04174 [Hirsutella rhossiliensis]KAH0966158.1 hypothetical protein HRG_04174 [Hirsutella rhossiliensis]
MAQQSSDLPLVPERLPALPDDHVAKVQVPQKFGDACYQNSGGQILQKDSSEKPIKVLKYPCISAQEIFGFCQQKPFEENVAAQKECLFSNSSTLQSDFLGCNKCEQHYGLGSVEYIDKTLKRFDQLRGEYLNNNPKGLPFKEFDKKFPQPGKEGTPIPSQARVDAKGVTSINILDYWSDFRLPQQGGAPIPKKKNDTSSSIR